MFRMLAAVDSGRTIVHSSGFSSLLRSLLIHFSLLLCLPSILLTQALLAPLLLSAPVVPTVPVAPPVPVEPLVPFGLIAPSKLNAPSARMIVLISALRIFRTAMISPPPALLVHPPALCFSPLYTSTFSSSNCFILSLFHTPLLFSPTTASAGQILAAKLHSIATCSYYPSSQLPVILTSYHLHSTCSRFVGGGWRFVIGGQLHLTLAVLLPVSAIFW